MIKTNSPLLTVEDETIIWRYMDFVSFYSVIKNKSLFFRRLDKYPDQLEGTLSAETIENLYKHHNKLDNSSTDNSRKWAQDFAKSVELGKAYNLSNSWSIQNEENYALWKIYLHGHQEGVAIKSTAKRLKDSLQKSGETVYIDKVTYDQRSLEYDDINIFNVATNKIKPYNFENECRAFIIGQIQFNKNDGNPPHPKYSVGAEIAADLEILIDKLFVSPFAGHWFTKLVESLVSEHLPSFDKTQLVSSIIREAK